MLIDKIKHPILRFAHNGEIKISTPDELAFRDIVSNESLIKEILSFKNDNIDYLSKGFVDAMVNSQNSFSKISNDVEFRKRLNDCGIIICGGIEVSYRFTDGGLSSLWFIDGVCAIINTANITFRTSVPALANNVFLHDARYRYSLILSFLLFKKYAKIEEKIINRKSRQTIGDNKYKNKSDLNINIMDCTWFTTIVRNEGFAVRGHFRLQPKKDCSGNWTRELIYINEFQKQGYTKKAKLLST